MLLPRYSAELKGDATLLIGVLCLKCSRNYRLVAFLLLNASIKGKRSLLIRHVDTPEVILSPIKSVRQTMAGS